MPACPQLSTDTKSELGPVDQFLRQILSDEGIDLLLQCGRLLLGLILLGLFFLGHGALLVNFLLILANGVTGVFTLNSDPMHMTPMTVVVV